MLPAARIPAPRSRRVPRIISMLVAMLGALTLIALGTTRAQAQTATMLPAFKGGVRADARLADPSIVLPISSACYASHPFARYKSAAPAESCIIAKLKQAGAGAQAIAFARFAPVPAAISSFTNYATAAAVFAVMRWADGDAGWCIIGRSGAAVPLWGEVKISDDAQFAAFAKIHHDVIPWMPTGADDAPRVVDLADGAQRFIFRFALKTCHACAIDGDAAVGFDFDRRGAYTGVHLVGITPPTPASAAP
jgi:hypothetical protein